MPSADSFINDLLGALKKHQEILKANLRTPGSVSDRDIQRAVDSATRVIRDARNARLGGSDRLFSSLLSTLEEHQRILKENLASPGAVSKRDIEAVVEEAARVIEDGEKHAGPRPSRGRVGMGRLSGDFAKRAAKSVSGSVLGDLDPAGGGLIKRAARFVSRSVLGDLSPVDEGMNRINYLLGRLLEDDADSSGDPEFDKWLEDMNVILKRNSGVDYRDLEDKPYRDWYDDGVTPSRAARRALRDID